MASSPRSKHKFLPVLLVVVLVMALGFYFRWCNRTQGAPTPKPAPQWPETEKQRRDLKEFERRWSEYDSSKVREVSVPVARRGFVADFLRDKAGATPRGTYAVESWQEVLSALNEFLSGTTPTRWWTICGHGKVGLFNPNEERTDVSPDPFEIPRYIRPPITVADIDFALISFGKAGAAFRPNGEYTTDDREYHAILGVLIRAQSELGENGVFELAACDIADGEGEELGKRLAFALRTTVVIYEGEVRWKNGSEIDGHARAFLYDGK